MNKKIITIAGIIFALIFVVLLAVMMGTITTKANSANSKLVDTLEMTDNTSLSIYDNKIVKGESVISAIQNVRNLGGGVKLEIKVKTTGGTEQKYGYVGDKDGLVEHEITNPVEYEITNPNDDNYINSTANFQSKLLKNSNDVVTGISFEQKQ